MKDSNNVDQVRSKVLELELALRNFYEAHDKYHVLIDDNDFQDSIEYFRTVKDMGAAVMQTFDMWLKSVELKLQEELDLAISLHPEDSISQPPASTPLETDEKTVEDSESQEELPLTLASHLATSTPCQIKEEGTVEAPECQEQLPLTPAGHLPTSTSCPVKDEKTAEVPECEDHLPLIPPSQPPASTPCKIKEENSVEIPKKQTEENQEVNSTPLNPKVPVWIDDKHFISMSQRESSEKGLFERHPDLSQKNVSHMVEVQKLQQHQNQQLQELLKQQQQQTLAMTLPEPDISVFSGDSVDYSDFVRAFENLIETKTSSPNSRLYYLVQYTSGEVKELMQSCLSMKPEEGYKTARALLKDRYGQSYKIATALVDRVTKSP
ncbi:hypothetical protein ACROYT_G000433 [Oculina patagonica]